MSKTKAIKVALQTAVNPDGSTKYIVEKVEDLDYARRGMAMELVEDCQKYFMSILGFGGNVVGVCDTDAKKSVVNRKYPDVSQRLRDYGHGVKEVDL